MKHIFIIFVLTFLWPSLSLADNADAGAPASTPSPTPSPGGVCLTEEQKQNVLKAVQELDDIHKAPATAEFEKPIVIINDWQGRVYINGGDKAPLKMRVRIGPTVDREMAVVLPAQVSYRPQPADPMFRLRVRAEFGLLVPQIVQTLLGTKQNMLDGGLALDFFHVGIFNVAIYGGVFSSGLGLGLDITKNFGITSNVVVRYEGLLNGADYLSNFTGIYFSFN